MLVAYSLIVMNAMQNRITKTIVTVAATASVLIAGVASAAALINPQPQIEVGSGDKPFISIR